MNNNNYLKIMSWNCQSIIPKVSELSQFVEKHCIKVILIQESWLASHSNFKFRNFSIYRNDRISNTTTNCHGGVAILVDPSINHSFVKKYSSSAIESITIKINGPSSSFEICSTYCPPAICINNFERQLNQIMCTSDASLFCGDWNAKHFAWNNNKNDKRGNSLNKIIDHHSFKIHAPSEATLFPSRGSPSIVDFGITKNFDFISKINVSNDLSSDHLPVIFEIDFCVAFNDIKIFNFSKANWTNVKKDFDKRFQSLDIPNNFNSESKLNKAVEFFQQTVETVSIKNIPVKQPYFFRYISNTEIKVLTKKRNAFCRAFQNTNDVSYKILMNETNRIIKLKTKEFHQKEFDRKISLLNHKDYSVYRFIGAIKNKKIALPPLVNDEGEIAYCNNEKASFLAQAFYQSHTLTNSLPSIEDNNVLNSISFINNSAVIFPTEYLVTIKELKFMIKKLKVKKARGVDNISNIILKNLPDSGLKFIMNIFNSCLKTGYFPLAWKIGKVVSIPKPNKNNKIPSNYRPITLLSSLGKLFERVNLNLLQKHEMFNDIFIPQQFGFRYEHSTTHQILRITKNVSLNFNKNLSTGMVLLDIEKAFDSVWHSAILHKLLKFKYPIYLIKIIQSFLNDRKSFVQVFEAKSESFNIPAGVPQGSLLSPHLFNIFVNDIPKPHLCDLAMYADDSALIASTLNPRSLISLTQILSAGLNELKLYFDRWKIKLNSSKTEAILFTHSKLMNKEKPNIKIKFNDQILDWKDCVKYLGVILDQKLLFKSNIDYNIKKAKKTMVVIYSLLRKQSFLNTDSKKILYTAYIRSILMYACPVFANCAQSHIKKLQIFQNKCLRMVLNAPYATKISTLHEDSELLYIHEFIKKITDRLYNKSKYSASQLIQDLDDYSTNVIRFKIKHRLPRKMGLKK